MNLQHKQRRIYEAFTLIELLAVMMIMGIVITTVTTAYLGMMRGAGMRAALNQLRTDVILARQKAITDGNNISLVFEEAADGAEVYYIVQSVGTTTSAAGITLRDDLNPELRYTVRGTKIYNITDRTFGIVESVHVDENAGEYWVNFSNEYDGVFNGPDIPYGFMTHTEQRLPEGFYFDKSQCGGDIKKLSMNFFPDGTVVRFDDPLQLDPPREVIIGELIATNRTITLEISRYGELTTRETYN
ncbi:hypothetical protein BVX97_00165 [bacterium E08(2017)]|nr:hypothetical protein BVX97_00165 [bacterium E08(2017)]